ncbi:unnamed protein product [Adineta steineri]|uniref:ATPase AAA-type core domain-containing protein n=2 Tax=Adineta steineri TaxID=433720 RepID=A0A815MQD0_9BILA|nr:unnamed protein product [Adineta steineri]CAF1426394.1 unnamed protein product [Adineta steineri]
MSQKHLQTVWTGTQIKLSRLVTSEISASKGFDSKRQANNYVRELFIQYNDIMRKLDEIYETLIHPQKRLIIRILLDGIVGRLVELKREMIKFDNCEYTYFEDLALDHNKTLDDLCIKIPRYFSQDRFKAVEQRNHTIEMILNRLDHSKTNLSIRTSSKSLLITKTNQTNVITLAHAVRILQAYERARQGRVHAYFMHRMKNEVKITETKLINDNHLNDSCLIIQTIWRQKYSEKLFYEKKIEQQKLLGMILPQRKVLTTDDSYERDKKRRDLQLQHQQQLDESPDYIKQKIRQYEETEVKSRIEHVLIQWLLESRQLYGQFPIYPSNGSDMLFKDITLAEVQEFVNKQAQLLKNRKAKRKELKKQIKKPNKKQPKQKSNLNELESSKFIPLINNQMGIYKELFYERDESYNKEQHYDILLSIDHFRPDVENELRHDVDNILRNELIYLKLAIDNVNDKQIKKSKKKKKKKKRNKKVKDIIANRTNDSIFEELIETGIIIPTKLVRQQDFIGDYQYNAETIRYNEKEPMPSLLDCQQLVILQIIFPLCSQNIHMNLSSHKAVLLAGPHGSGKQLLVHIACNELGGLLLDLSPSNLAKSFNTIDGLKILFAMIKRLVLTMSPILCMIRDTELLFSKKLTLQEKEYEPKRFKRIMHKFIRKIKPGERIMFIGLSSQPYRARIKQLLKVYEHIILFTKPNYGSRRKIFYEILLEKNHMNVNDVELSILASVSKGYTAGQILETIYKVIKIKHEDKYSNNVCTANDFISILGLKTPVFIDEENKIKNWYAKTPNGIKRLNEITQTSVKSTKTSLKTKKGN